MKGYELSPEATDDLQEIWVYIANDNPAAADKLEEDIYAACELLAKSPGLGHRRSDLTDEPVPLIVFVLVPVLWESDVPTLLNHHSRSNVKRLKLPPCPPWPPCEPLPDRSSW